MNSSVTRTELLAFWYWIEKKPSPSIDMSKPASRSAAALSSSLALHQMNSRMSGWSTSSTTIFAARRVLPPDLIVPAQASAPRMKLTGPDAVPPLASGSIEPRIFERLIPEPEPPRKMLALLGVPVEDRLHVVLDREDEAGRASSGSPRMPPTLNHTGELNAAIWCSRMWVSSASKHLGVLVGREVAALATPGRDRARDPADHLLDRVLARGRPQSDRGSTSARRCWSRSATTLFGNSTSRCSNETLSPWPIRASRSSHSTASNGWTPGRGEIPPDREALAGLRRG